MEFLLHTWLLSNLAVRDHLLMSKNPLHMLQKGLAKLKVSIKERKDSPQWEREDIWWRWRVVGQCRQCGWWGSCCWLVRKCIWLQTWSHMAYITAEGSCWKTEGAGWQGHKAARKQKKKYVWHVDTCFQWWQNSGKGPDECKQKPQAEKQKAKLVFTKKENVMLSQWIEVLLASWECLKKPDQDCSTLEWHLPKITAQTAHNFCLAQGWGDMACSICHGGEQRTVRQGKAGKADWAPCSQWNAQVVGHKGYGWWCYEFHLWKSFLCEMAIWQGLSWYQHQQTPGNCFWGPPTINSQWP